MIYVLYYFVIGAIFTLYLVTTLSITPMYTNKNIVVLVCLWPVGVVAYLHGMYQAHQIIKQRNKDNERR